MAGKKNFINNTNETLSVSLFVRPGANDIGNAASEERFELLPNMTYEQNYGNSENIYLNIVKWTYGNTFAELVVKTRGDASDSLMNTNSFMAFHKEGSEVKLTGSNNPNMITCNGRKYSLADGNIYEVNAKGESIKIGYGVISLFSVENTLRVIMPDGNTLQYNGSPNNWSTL